MIGHRRLTRMDEDSELLRAGASSHEPAPAAHRYPCLRFEVRERFEGRLRTTHLMEGEHRDVYEKTLHVFLTKLQIVTSILKSMQVYKPRPEASAGSTIAVDQVDFHPRRFKYARQKDSLDKAFEELDIWQGTADHSWFLLMKITDPRVDAAIALPEEKAGQAGQVSTAEIV